MLNDFEKSYMVLYRRLQKEQWENYFEDGHHDLSAVDGEIYNLVKSYYGKISGTNRKSEIARLITQKACVEKNPQVSCLRNRLDNPENYTANMPMPIRKQGELYRQELANRMRSDVLDLMKLRNSLARDLGYDSYVDLVLSTEEIDRAGQLTLLHEYLNKNLDKTLGLIKKYGITFDGWFDDLGRIGASLGNYDPISMIHELLETLGFNEVLGKTKVLFRNDGFSGYCVELWPNDIRLVVEPIKSLDNLRTLFHELGHAVSYGLNAQEGFFRILPANQDEAMAVAFEHIASTLLSGQDDQRRLHELMTLEYTRCSISALFEFDLWQNPEKADELYKKHYEKLGLEIEDSSLWTIDSFRSIDPVHIQNYVIGASVAGKMVNYLDGLYASDYQAWGSWLRNNVYYEGRLRTLGSKFAIIGGPRC